MKTDSDWDNRILCSDGSCIGVIGPDGHCKECGKKFEGTLPASMVADTQSRSEDDAAPGAGTDSDTRPQPSTDTSFGAETEDDDWANRQLCSDGNCIGVIGSDGRCKECGKALE